MTITNFGECNLVSDANKRWTDCAVRYSTFGRKNFHLLQYVADPLKSETVYQRSEL